jgi:hypothetical protein
MARTSTAEREGVSFAEALKRVRAGFDGKWEGTWERPTGGIQDDDDN